MSSPGGEAAKPDSINTSGIYNVNDLALVLDDPAEYLSQVQADVNSRYGGVPPLIVVALPQQNLSLTDKRFLEAHLAVGGKILMIGERSTAPDGPPANAAISDLIQFLGGSIQLVDRTVNENTFDNSGGSIRLGDRPILSGVSAFTTGSYATIRLDPSQAIATVVDSQGNIVVAEQLIDKGQIVVVGDSNPWDPTSPGVVTFSQNLLADSVANAAIVA
ncbi:hypothetical protein IQ225_07115, partial [Synechocystis salina LEGE 06155]|nr:hypothetical protein [Synechocystis salina LEGE 06155]